MTESKINEAIKQLNLLFPTKITLPDSPAYSAYPSTYFSHQAGSYTPAAIVIPTSAADVSLILKTISRYGIAFAVRGGGHNLNAGAANIGSEGVVVNMREMRSVGIVDVQGDVKAAKEVMIGGGARWAEVYAALDEAGLVTMGGRVADVGVGGLSTGGGISYFSAREGLVCDNITNFEVVIASGEVINANKNEHHDLFRALKGGQGSNFGIVTSITLPTFPQSPFYGGVVVASISTIDSQLQGLADLLENFDPYAALIMSISWNKDRDSFSIFCNVEYTKEDSDPPCMRPFTKAEPQFVNTMRMSTLCAKLTDFSVEVGRFVKSGLRNQFATTTFKASLQTLNEVYEIWKASVPSISHIESINWAMSFQPFLPSFSSKSMNSGGNVLGLNPEDGPLVLVLISYNWAREEHCEEVTAMAQKLIKDIDEATKAKGCYNRFKYLNYAANWQMDDVMEGYGEDNVLFLEEVRMKYDPNGLFQKKCPGGFKIISLKEN